ncbi:hypothetical protein BCE02nite_40330 [Brevibacillus centrosporus]|uniref:DUF6843 domain-containing protein n=2 Tax=Brevibacillus centrosporus TaxID=54910 RepID=UPI000F0A2910|nr:hypothetical protein EDM55_20745 [Brevibacillus centrosporus]GED32892.1 hypothetical protein BCE02nite_40330 [Brevibacillus centrosporus]
MTIKMIVRVAIVWAILTVTGCSASSEKTNDLYLMNEKGYFVASTPDMEYGRITDKYYYIDKQGQRKPIQNDCVRALGTGSLQPTSVIPRVSRSATQAFK